MENGGEMLQLCRLCLVKDDVNIPIFEEQGDIRQIFLKISSCLPVKVSREDKLPKKICDGCSYKLDMLYEFWNTSANAEKQLLSWLGEAGMNSQMTDGTISAVAQQIKPVETVVKQEEIDPSDINTEENDDDKSYMFQQKFSMDEPAGPSATVTSNDEEPPPPKRARRTAAVKAQIAMDNESDDDDDDSGEPMTKIEDESDESDGEDHEPAFVDVPSTSADDQPGPSGVGKDGVEAPYDIENIAYVEVFYNCSRCLETFTSLKSLEDHSKDHGEDVLNQAANINADEPKLKLEFSRTEIEPLQGYDSPKKLTCSGCDKYFTSRSTLLAHCNIYHKGERMDGDIAKYKCDKCNICFQKPYKLKAHLESHQGKTFSCDICSAKFLTSNYAETHKRRVHLKEYHVQCDLCNKTFYSMSYLKQHVKSVHLNEANFPCDKCSKSYKLDYHLETHRKAVHQGIRYECDHCKKVFRNLQYFNLHQKSHVPGYVKPEFTCPTCSKVLATRQAYYNHINIHNGKNQNICELCGKIVASKSSLRIHMRSHTGEKPFKCDFCEKRFTSKLQHKMHRYIHTKEKPFECQLCQKRFTQKGSLNVHMRYHSGERPYECTSCSKKFVTNTLLKNHTCKERK